MSWGSWRAEGYETGGTTPKEDVCSVDSDGVVAAGSGAIQGDVCKLYATASAPNYQDSEEFPLVSLILGPRAILGSITGPAYSDDLLLRGDPVSITTAPTLSPTVDGVAWSYRAEGVRSGDVTEDICSVDANTGVVIPGAAAMAGDTCKIYASVVAPGYEAKEGMTPTELTLKEFFESLTWASFPTEATVGVDINLSSNQPTSVPQYGGLNINITSDDCSYQNDTLSFAAATECVVEVTASKDGYVSIVETFRITPTNGTIQVSDWGSYGTVTVGTTADAPSVTVTLPANGIGVSSSYGMASDSTGCTVSNVGVVTGTAATSSCKVVRTLAATGYNDLEHTYTVTVGKGEQNALAWSGHPYDSASPTVALGATLAIATTAPVGQGAVEYRVASGDTSYCSVNSGDGTVTPKTAGAGEACVIEARFAGNANYNPSAYATIATITVNKRTQSDLAWSGHPYDSATPSVGFGATLAIATAEPTGQGDVEYRVASGDTSHCEVATDGTVTPLAAGIGEDCVIEARFAGNATYEASGYVTIATVSITKGTQSAFAWTDGNHPYGSASPRVTYGNTLSISTTVPTGQGAVEYRVASGSTNYCEVAADGTVTPLLEGLELNCEIEAQFAGNATYLASGYTTIATIAMDSANLGTIAWGSFPEGATLVVGGSAVAPSPTTHAGATVLYWVSSSTNCELVDEATGAVRAKAVDLTTTQQCILGIAVNREGYAFQGHQISINLEAGVQRGIAWNPGITSFQTSDTSAALGAVTGGDSADSITYGVTNAGGTNCAFTTSTDSTLTFNAVGTCQVQGTVARTGYSDWTSPVLDIEITVLDPVAITWSGYSDTNILGLGDATPLTVTVDPTGATLSFSVEAVPANACTVHSTNGTLTAAAAGTCYVTLSATDSGGTRAVGKKVVAVTVEVLDAFDFTTAGVPGYGDTKLALGFQLDAENFPNTDDNLNAVEWSLAAAGTRRGAPQNGVCSVETDSNSDNFGRISAGADAELGDVCTVTIMGGADGFADYRQDIALRLRHPHPLQVVGGYNTSCALFEGGRVKCWGRNNHGQAGIGSNSGTKENIGDADGEMGGISTI